VRRALGHSSPEITAATYDHSDLEDFREQVDRALSFARVTPDMQRAKNLKGEGRDPIGNPMQIAAFQKSGRLDLNQRPLAPEAAPEAAQPSSTLPNPSESFRSAPLRAVQRSQRFVTSHRDFATNLLPPIEQFLTVRQVVQFLGVCTATVYKWATEGVLPHVRIVNVIRIRPEDLTRFVNDRSR
jgi:excisionase family DNA binding protein